MVSCRAGRQRGKELRELVPRREQPEFPASASQPMHSLALSIHACVRVCSQAWPGPSLPIPGLTHQGGPPLTAPCQGTKVRGREGAASVAAMAGAVSLVSWHTVSYCSFQLWTPASSAERQWWQVEESKTVPLPIPEQGTAGGTQIGPGTPLFLSWSWREALTGLPTIGHAAFREAGQCLQRELLDCGCLAFPWSQSLDSCPSLASCLHRPQMSVLTKITLSLSPWGPGFLRALGGPG